MCSVLNISWETVMCSPLIWLLWDHIISAAVASGGMWFSFTVLCFTSCEWTWWCKRKRKGTIDLTHPCKNMRSPVTVVAAGSTTAAAGDHSSSWALQITSDPVSVASSPGSMPGGASRATVLLLLLLPPRLCLCTGSCSSIPGKHP